MPDLFTVSYGEILWDSYDGPAQRILIMATLASQSKEAIGLLATDGLAQFEAKRDRIRFPKPDIRLFKCERQGTVWQLVDYDERLPGDTISLKDWVLEYESVLESDVVRLALQAKMPMLQNGFLQQVAGRLVSQNA